MNFLLCIGAAVLFSLVIFVKKWQGGAHFEPIKFGATMATAVVVGIIAAIKGTTPAEITLQWITTQLATYGGVILIFQFVIQIIVRWIRGKR